MATKSVIEMPLIDTVYIDVNKAKTRKKSYEEVDTSSETEQAGYIPATKQIENMILAGQRLDASRLQFDFASEDEIDEELCDPTRSGNFDLADASQAQIAVQQSLREQAVKASQTVQEPSQAIEPQRTGVSTPEPEKGA